MSACIRCFRSWAVFRCLKGECGSAAKERGLAGLVGRRLGRGCDHVRFSGALLHRQTVIRLDQASRGTACGSWSWQRCEPKITGGEVKGT